MFAVSCHVQKRFGVLGTEEQALYPHVRSFNPRVPLGNPEQTQNFKPVSMVSKLVKNVQKGDQETTTTNEAAEQQISIFAGIFVCNVSRRNITRTPDMPMSTETSRQQACLKRTRKPQCILALGSRRALRMGFPNRPQIDKISIPVLLLPWSPRVPPRDQKGFPGCQTRGTRSPRFDYHFSCRE